MRGGRTRENVGQTPTVGRPTEVTPKQLKSSSFTPAFSRCCKDNLGSPRRGNQSLQAVGVTMAQKGFREKFQAAKLLFFPPKIEDTPRNAVKGRLKELMFTERYGVTPEDLEALRERVKQVVAEYLEMYPEDVHRTRLQPALKINFARMRKNCTSRIFPHLQMMKINIMKCLYLHLMTQNQRIIMWLVA
ncbi:hypothetical protein CYMTET_45235 [Cymbomonas tetramitiformis]|uniref:Uncharacterized protein n=1 Tax=Cymbomonas tetramitiformis TaxID=36881 RepID=A0AAE0EY83_9CHLO|nr:hypothetical protein CYMTET_45235 [Cymbomonas tetramitiformis]